LLVSAPAEGVVTNTQSVAVSGQVQDGTLPLTVKVNGTSATVNGRYFSAALTLAEGDFAVSIVASDAAGRTASTTRKCVDRTARYCNSPSPGNPAPSTRRRTRSRGRGDCTSLEGVGWLARHDPGGQFSALVVAHGSDTR
jgi:hypothetical protein